MPIFNTINTISTINVITQEIYNVHNNSTSVKSIAKALNYFIQDLRALANDELVSLRLRKFVISRHLVDHLENYSKLLASNNPTAQLPLLTTYLFSEHILLNELRQLEAREEQETALAIETVQKINPSNDPLHFSELGPYFKRVILDLFVTTNNGSFIAIRRAANKYSQKYFRWLFVTSTFLAEKENPARKFLNLEPKDLPSETFYEDVWKDVKNDTFKDEINKYFYAYRPLQELFCRYSVENVLQEHFTQLFTSADFLLPPQAFIKKTIRYMHSLEGTAKASAGVALLNCLTLERKELLTWICENINYNDFPFLQQNLLSAVQKLNDAETTLDLIPHAIKFKNFHDTISLHYDPKKSNSTGSIASYLDRLSLNRQMEIFKNSISTLAHYYLGRGNILRVCWIYAFILTYNVESQKSARDLLKGLLLSHTYNEDTLLTIIDSFAETFVNESAENLALALKQLSELTTLAYGKKISDFPWDLFFERVCRSVDTMHKVHFFLIVFNPFIQQTTIKYVWNRIVLIYPDLSSAQKKHLQSTVKIVINCTIGHEDKKNVLKEAYMLHCPPTDLEKFIRKEIGLLYHTPSKLILKVGSLGLQH